MVRDNIPIPIGTALLVPIIYFVRFVQKSIKYIPITRR